MKEMAQLQEAIREELVRIRLRNPSYSIRSFSRRLKLSPATLSQVLNGKRSVSLPLARKISDLLQVPEDRKTEILSSLEQANNQRRSGKNGERVLTSDVFRAIADWHHFGILALLETENATFDLDWISKRLGLNPRIIGSSLKRLARLKLLEKDQNGWRITGASFHTTDGIPNQAIRRAHRQALKAAARALDRVTVDRRDFTTLTMAVNPEKLPEALKIIREARSRISDLMESGPKKEVYMLAIQLFPLSE